MKSLRKIFMVVCMSMAVHSAVIAATVPAGITGEHTYQATGTVDVAFSPNGGITAMIINEISLAKTSIEVQAYWLSNIDIGNALVAAHQRGVLVRINLDKSQETASVSLYKNLKDAGIPVKVDRQLAIAHNKIMIIDNKNIITGSFNFTRAAETSNGENCLVLHDNEALANLYKEYWLWRWNNSYTIIPVQ